jgi:hypothetical protein
MFRSALGEAFADAGNIAATPGVMSAFAGTTIAADELGCGDVIIDFADCVVADAARAGVFFGGAGSATAAGVEDFSCVFTVAAAPTVAEVFTLTVECTDLVDADALFGSADLVALEATSATGFAAGDGCVVVAGAKFFVDVFTGAATDVIEATGVVAGGGAIGATVCPGALATAREARLAAGFSESSGSAGKSGNAESAT